MTARQWNTAIDMWNDGKSLGEISAALGVGIYDLTAGSSLLGVVSRLAREMTDAPDDARIVIPDHFKKGETDDAA